MKRVVPTGMSAAKHALGASDDEGGSFASRAGQSGYSITYRLNRRAVAQAHFSKQTSMELAMNDLERTNTV